MPLVDVKRLAAVDMHGARGTLLRRRIILAEFVLGALLGTAIGAFVAVSASGLGWRVFGAWLAGIGLNYVPLAIYAASLSSPGRLDAELAGVDLRRELRRYTKLQFWITVPLLLVALAVPGQPDR
jgi:hypothetical protein